MAGIVEFLLANPLFLIPLLLLVAVMLFRDRLSGRCGGRAEHSRGWRFESVSADGAARGDCTCVLAHIPYVRRSAAPRGLEPQGSLV